MATSDFGKAFRAARSSGKKTFKWNGKLYTTKLKGEGDGKQPKNVPVPEKRPDPDTTSSVERTKDDAAEKKAAPAKDEPINPDKYKGTPQAERDRGDLTGPRKPPEKKVEAKPAEDKPKKKKTGPFGLGGMFKLGDGSTFK